MSRYNSIFSKPFLITLFWKQNKHHRHGVLIHTLRVFWETLRHKDFKLLPAALLHDIGKPFVAYQKEEDKISGEYSFTDHEELSYRIIENWPVSDYTKSIVRYHYLIRDIEKSLKKGDMKRYEEKRAIWERLNEEMREDLRRFLKYDDLGKGK